MNILSTVSFFFGLLLAASVVEAHSDLAHSNPANGAVVHKAPEKIELHFTEDVRLLKFSISGSKGGEVATEFKPSAASQASFAITLPALAEDSYSVSLTAMGGDAHAVEKSFNFIVDADAEESAGTTEHAESSHSH